MAGAEIASIGRVFGAVLQRYRLARNITQEELAFQAGVDRTFVSRLERGVRQPTITTLIGMGQALGVSAADLVRETEQEYLRQGQSCSGVERNSAANAPRPSQSN